MRRKSIFAGFICVVSVRLFHSHVSVVKKNTYDDSIGFACISETTESEQFIWRSAWHLVIYGCLKREIQQIRYSSVLL